jgi:arsenate reductase
MHDSTRVLFVSDANSARSQMAEALLRKLGGDRLEVHSAGFEPSPLHPLAVKAMAEIGIDISSQRSKHFNDYLETQFDYAILLCDRGRQFCADFPHDHATLHWVCDDPTEARGTEAEKMEAFRRAREQIRGEVEQWLATKPPEGRGSQ